MRAMSVVMKLLRLLFVAGIAAFGVYTLFLLHLPPLPGLHTGTPDAYAPKPLPIPKPIPNLVLDLTRPDALIRSYSLSKLPADLLRVPLARDVLTEDFVTYYQQNDRRLAISGTVRRIAFEHKLSLPEKLIESTLDEPGEIALWLDEGGRLQYFALLLSRNTLARLLQAALPVIAKVADLQLSSLGKLNASDVEILALNYGHRDQLLLLAKGDRVLVLSHPGMLFASGETGRTQSEPATQVLRTLLDHNKGEEAISPFARHFQRDEPLSGKKHELTLGAHAFAFGYERFTPGLEALSLIFNDQGAWQSAALFNDDAAPRDGNLWAVLPYGSALCADLPVSWAQMTPLLENFDLPKTLADRFDGPAAVCWYKNSRLYTPLFTARLKPGVDAKTGVNAEEAEAFFALAAQATRAEGEKSFDAEKGFALWRGKVASRFGSPDKTEAGDNRKPRSLKPALAIERDLVFFSPDATLVDNALNVAAKRYPALADSFTSGGSASTLAYIAPEALADLLQTEIFAALPRDEEALFRNAADAYLLPRLKALARYPAQRLKFGLDAGNNARAWRTLEWETARTAR